MDGLSEGSSFRAAHQVKVNVVQEQKISVWLGEPLIRYTKAVSRVCMFARRKMESTCRILGVRKRERMADNGQQVTQTFLGLNNPMERNEQSWRNEGFSAGSFGA